MPNCVLDDLKMGENLLEAGLLKVTRDIYADNTEGIIVRRTEDPGITGLIDEMRQFMLSPVGRPAEKQQQARAQRCRRWEQAQRRRQRASEAGRRRLEREQQAVERAEAVARALTEETASAEQRAAAATHVPHHAVRLAMVFAREREICVLRCCLCQLTPSARVCLWEVVRRSELRYAQQWHA